MTRTSIHRRAAVILTALNVETEAVLRHLTRRRERERTIDGTVFYLGRFEDWDIAVAEAGAGNSSAAAIAERAIANFHPSVALFIGIAGGIKDVAIGDVVVADKIYRYESGKDDETGFRPRPEVKNSAHAIEQRGRALPKSRDWLKRLDHRLGRRSPKVFVGAIAAGEKVVASTRSVTAAFLHKHYSDALAVEMEGAGFLEAVNINALVLGGVVRGISDLLTGKTEADESGSQPLAADAASAAAFEILHAMPRHERSPTRKPAKRPRGRTPEKPPKPPAVLTPATAPVTSAVFLETPSTFSRAAYFDKGEVLARIGVPNVDEVLFSYFDPPDAYLRVIPIKALARPLPLAALRESASHAPLLRSQPGCLSTTNRRGAITYDPAGSYAGGPAPLKWSTQLFENGELWATSNTMIIRERNGRPVWLPLPLIPALVFERLFYDKLHAAVAFATEYLNVTFPCQIELGLLGLDGVRLGINTEDIRGPIHAAEAICRSVLANGQTATINDVLLEFFKKVHDLTGYERPQGLHAFPPGPPRP